MLLYYVNDLVYNLQTQILYLSIHGPWYAYAMIISV